MYREKEAFLILKILFYLQVEILHRGYLVLTASLCIRLNDQSVRLNVIRDGNR